MRTIVQFAFDTYGDAESIKSDLHVLCNDGTIYFLQQEKWVLFQVPPVPQDGYEEDLTNISKLNFDALYKRGKGETA